MSHFTVMVFGEDPEGQLAPYDENLGEECEDPKWDWYSLGGRWSGYFKAKDINKIFLGTPGVFDNVPANGYGDAMEKGNIDLDESVKHCMVPYAYVKDGEWFGVPLDEMNYDEYLKSFWDTFNSLPDDTMVYLYDCHI